MYIDKDNSGKVSVNDLTTDEAELLQIAVLKLAEETDDNDRARFLRGVAIQLDSFLPRR